IDLFQSVNRSDVGVIQRCQHPRFTLESRNAFRVVAEGFRKELDGNTAAEFHVGGLIDVSHSARTQVTCDLVVCEPSADHGVNENSGCRFYQTTRMSLPPLTFLRGKRGKESQLARNPRNRNVDVAVGPDFHKSGLGGYKSAGGSLKKLVCF